jgi:hypothetical protein
MGERGRDEGKRGERGKRGEMGRRSNNNYRRDLLNHRMLHVDFVHYIRCTSTAVERRSH